MPEDVIDILACHSRRCTSVIGSINNNYVTFRWVNSRVLVLCRQASCHGFLVIINKMYFTCAFLAMTHQIIHYEKSVLHFLCLLYHSFHLYTVQLSLLQTLSKQCYYAVLFLQKSSFFHISLFEVISWHQTKGAKWQKRCSWAFVFLWIRWCSAFWVIFFLL